MSKEATVGELIQINEDGPANFVTAVLASAVAAKLCPWWWAMLPAAMSTGFFVALVLNTVVNPESS